MNPSIIKNNTRHDTTHQDRKRAPFISYMVRTSTRLQYRGLCRCILKNAMAITTSLIKVNYSNSLHTFPGGIVLYKCVESIHRSNTTGLGYLPCFLESCLAIHRPSIRQGVVRVPHIPKTRLTLIIAQCMASQAALLHLLQQS
jgi:hypothetical protein